MGRFDPDKADYSVPSGSEPAPASGGRFAPDKHFAPVTGAAPPPPGASTSWGETLGRYGQTADDFVRAAANTLSFGMADRLAGLTGGGTDAQVKLSEEARKRSPIASIAGDVGGGVAIPGLGGGMLAARGIRAGVAPWLARVGGYGAEGATVGAAQGAGGTYTGNLPDYVKNAATGGAIGGAAGGVLGGILGPRDPGARSTAETPSTDRLYTEKQANYRDLANQPQMYEPHAVSFRSDDLNTQLRGAPNLFEPGTAPVSFRGLDHLQNPPTQAHLGRGAPVSPGDLEAIIQGINKNVVQGSPDSAAAGIVKRGINDFILNPPPGAVMPGMQQAASEATALANRARGNYGAYRRGEFMDDLVENARTSAGSAYSGLNLQNILRQGARSAVRRTKGESPASRAHFEEPEIGALTEYARVKPADEALRYVDRIMGGGGGLGAAAATTAGIAGGTGAGWLQGDPTAGALLGASVLPAGLALRMFGNRRALRQINELGDTIRQRSPLYQERAAVAPMVEPGKSGSQMLRDAITAGLISQDFGQ